MTQMKNRKFIWDRKFAVQAVIVALMYCGAYGIMREKLQAVYEDSVYIDGIIYTIYYISAVLGGTIWLAYLRSNRRKTALAAHIFLSVSMACQLSGIIYECLFGVDAVGFMGVLVFGVTPGAALLAELSILAGYYGKSVKYKSACIWFNCTIISIGIVLYIVLFLYDTITHFFENLDMLFLIGIKGTFLTIMWEEEGV